jgi:uncharacterized membrane protein (DUF485 family)
MKTAGESTRQMANERRKMRRLIAVSVLAIFFAGACVILLLMAYNVKIMAAMGLTGAIVVAGAMLAVKFVLGRVSDSAFASMDFLHKREKDAVRGAEGEEAVGQILENFAKSRHMVLHDVKCPYGNLDHILLTESGKVFLIETKAHGGSVTLDKKQTLLINNQPAEKDFIKQAIGNTYWFKEELDRITGEATWVNTIIVFANAFVPKPYVVKNVLIINKRFLREHLSKTDQKPTTPNLWPHAEQIRASLEGRAIPLRPMPPPAFYLYLNEQVKGPFSSDQIKALLQVDSANPETPCCPEGVQEWQTIAALVN